MSYTKNTLLALIAKNNKIQTETLHDNDLTGILEALNSIMEIGERFSESDSDTSFYWNEIISEVISVIHASISGYPRLALSGLRNILELACHSFYFYDHKIELNIAKNENSKANKYVSALVRDDSFYMTSYITAFNNGAVDLEKNKDSISSFLSLEYSKLCDVVHGRNKTLFKKESLKISYKKVEFKQFETHYLNIMNIIAIMYILRFNDRSSFEINKLASRTQLLQELS